LASDFEYEAFLSYRRSDGSRYARTLRRVLMEFRFPRALRAYQRPRPPAIYFDRIFESATEDFFEHTIKPALEHSRQLIIVATPDSRKPRANGVPNWVVREIQHFASFVPPRAILVAVAKGDLLAPLPAAVDELLPNVQRVDIRGLTPLRFLWPPLAWRAHDEILGLVASLYTVAPRDMPTLRQEAARRRNVNISTLAVGALALVGLLSGLLIWAVTSERVTRSTAMALGAERVSSVSRDRAFELATNAFALARTLEAERVLWSFLDTGNVIAVLPVRRTIKSVASSPDGKQVAVSTDQGETQIWNPAIPSLMFKLDGGGCATYSPDGSTIVTAGAKEIRMSKSVDGTNIATLPMSVGPDCALSFSNDGSRLLIKARGFAAVWAIQERRQVWEIPQVGGGISKVVLSPDGHKVLVAQSDGWHWITELDSGATLFIPASGKKSISAAAFSRDGASYAIGFSDGVVEGYAVGNPTPLWHARVHLNDIREILFLESGFLLTVGRDGFVYLLSPSDGRFVSRAVADRASVEAAYLSRTRDIALTVGVGPPAGGEPPRVWSLTHTAFPTMVAELAGHNERVISAALSADAEIVVTASDDLTARVWRTRNNLILNRFDGHVGPIRSALWFHDNDRLLTGGKDGTVRLWSSKANALLWRAQLSGTEGILDLAISPDQKLAVSGGDNGRCTVFSVSDGNVVTTFDARSGKKYIVNVRFAPDGAHVASSDGNGHVRIWEAITGTQVADLSHPIGDIEKFAFAPDGRLVTGGSDGTLRVWGGERWNASAIVDRGAGRPRFIVFSPDGKRAAWNYNADGVKIVESKHWTAIMPVERTRMGVRRAQFSATGDRLLSLAADGVRIWIPREGTFTRLGDIIEGSPEDADFSPVANRVAVAGYDEINLWDADRGFLLAKFRVDSHRLSQVRFSPDGAKILATTDDGAIRVFPATQEWLLNTARATLLRLPKTGEVFRWDDYWAFGTKPGKQSPAPKSGTSPTRYTPENKDFVTTP
jgi:WD40 repeat protein